MLASSLVAWLDDRLRLGPVKESLRHKTVPVHRWGVIYYLGGMTLFLLLVQLATGILLMLYYRPSEDEAYASVEFIMTSVNFGWLVRSIHSWSANLMIFFAVVHLATLPEDGPSGILYGHRWRPEARPGDPDYGQLPW